VLRSADEKMESLELAEVERAAREMVEVPSTEIDRHD